ncbi:lipid-A-disaccharide synthase [Lichenihabitans psoromatis]|uniref:lipid-A-disaccharide synthase n=1 Tax=Lichenihabitans psoromatis TaxID=2528642 RepID=UPI001FDEBA4A|nr:lipid-A-disaccharide synthase [Lichenihabitans psoromatis]
MKPPRAVGGASDRRETPLRLFIVAGEHSGDQLGFKLMRALRRLSPRPLAFAGVGGDRMEAEGLRSLFPLTDIAVMGILPVIKRLPTVLRRISETAAAAVAFKPDALIIIDSPDFTHRVARRVRRRLPGIPVIDYVSPTVWAWRTGRAKAMRAYVDHVLALLPFEPAAHARLGGPTCTYVGHPLIERIDEFRPLPQDVDRRREEPPVVVVLPGSRHSEIRRLMDDFGGALERLQASYGPLEVVLPAVDHLAAEIEARAAAWPVQVRILRGEAEKLAAFRRARVALAASGTVTLELALAGVPTVVAYRVTPVEMRLRFLIKVPSIVLPNLVTGSLDIPEFIGDACTPERLAAALLPLLRETPTRQAQTDAMRRLDALMSLESGEVPSECAASVILRHIGAL